ncbi:superoxide dismutase [Ni] [Streptomyces albireticuli]|uniref:Uncharacterized protein n=1 Tax=Streptomyces albireticuli TaxID=1940 RepID=A0A2A2D6D9_9ACTN|nr:superoxide dismutase [Ni] [Streptomyces albireticuli]MCD9195163.1 hypothetical protein [Streptomyces albireticuli]PAU47084.1 hypothetical protein CK936_20680 [Streptomyces albireticuli]
MLSRSLVPKVKVSARCDLPHGVHDPARARVEADSVKALRERHGANESADFRARALMKAGEKELELTAGIHRMFRETKKV